MPIYIFGSPGDRSAVDTPLLRVIDGRNLAQTAQIRLHSSTLVITSRAADEAALPLEVFPWAAGEAHSGWSPTCEYQNDACPLVQLSPVMLLHHCSLMPTR